VFDLHFQFATMVVVVEVLDMESWAVAMVALEDLHLSFAVFEQVVVTSLPTNRR
jgi:hypothetical protein